MTQARLVPLLGMVIVGAVVGCGERQTSGAAADGEERSSGASTAPATVRTATVPANPCDWVTRDEVAALVGPLEGEAVPVRNIEQPEPSDVNGACLYTLAAQPELGGKGVLFEVSPASGVLYERAVGAMRDHFAAELRDGDAPTAPAPKPRTSPDTGWDYSGTLPMGGMVSYTGRIGHVSVSVTSQSMEVPQAKLAALAARIRDRVPDLPFLLPPDPMLEELNRMQGGGPEPPPSGPDPCGLLSRAEAEAVLGKLVVEPYRSSGNTALVDPHGQGCAYFTSGHHALVLMPHWDSGKMTFGMARGAGGLVASVVPQLGPDGESADTLDGPWDEASANGTTGDLYFLKGDRMLELSYLTSSTDAAGAVRLATLALERL
jgi:hypothetical protein